MCPTVHCLKKVSMSNVFFILKFVTSVPLVTKTFLAQRVKLPIDIH